jgi:hypothetical protein
MFVIPLVPAGAIFVLSLKIVKVVCSPELPVSAHPSVATNILLVALVGVIVAVKPVTTKLVDVVDVDVEKVFETTCNTLPEYC